MTTSATPTCRGDYCSPDHQPATVTDTWTGERWCEMCAANTRSLEKNVLRASDIEAELKRAIPPEDGRSHQWGGEQDDAIERLAGLIMYQQRRIANLEAAVAKLTGEVS